MFTASAQQPPVPLIFTRASGPTYWPSDRFARRADPWQRREREINALVLALPPELEAAIRKRFRSHLVPRRYPTARALPSRSRGLFHLGHLKDYKATTLCSEATIEVGYIERTLEAMEGEEGLTGLSRQYLLAVHLRRLRQLWTEFERRQWPEGSLTAFRRVLG